MIIRQASLDAFQKSAMKSFEDEMIEHCKVFSPNLCKTLTPEQLRQAIGAAIEMASRYGLTRRGPVHFYIDCMLLFGSSFPTDPQYPWMAEILVRDDFAEEMLKADALHEKVCDYLREVGGSDSRYMRGALRRLLRLAQANDLPLHQDAIEQDILRLLGQVWPEKLAYSGPETIQLLVSDAVGRARDTYGFTQPRSMALMAVLMVAFGHRCDDDPLFPWISKTLARREEDGPAVVAEKLERRTLVWFEAVLENELA
ncbi:hypothetical protein [Polyangium sorediatum]|uniref:Uncharacterized protein n=1 Tax=Polyangium sorediatum TaxID=889274 RepID=A0ABT6P9L9_9BACT|nr:hypothetical protein [Polyangium sorediatum]MDI1437314.1 hypothetical protein [Polyangium sorediatum]